MINQLTTAAGPDESTFIQLIHAVKALAEIIRILELTGHRLNHDQAQAVRAAQELTQAAMAQAKRVGLTVE